jgi:flagellar basal body-associated protein FliL
MAEPDQKETAPEKPKRASGIVGMILPGVLAAAAAFGGAKMATAHGAAPHVEPAHDRAPGPTLTLEPFLVTTTDQAKKMHAMKISLAIEFEATTKEETIKPLVPRLRDAVLTYLRTLTYEDASDAAKVEKTRNELLERVRQAGAQSAHRVLVTDMVVQ